MKILETIGVDVSKKIIDVWLHTKGLHKVFENNQKGFNQMIKWLNKNTDIAKESILFALEHTGLYSYNLSVFLAENEFNYVVLPGLEIKKSIGITRGKNDKIDAKRIALYAFEKRDRLKLDTQSPKNIIALKRLLSLRERIVKQRAGYKASLKELSEILSKNENKLLIKTQKNIINSLTKEVNTLEKEIETIILEDDQLKK